jgi:hypothetical protein
MHDAEPNALDESQTARHLTRMILDYLAEHPQAMDTVEGIAEWWVRRQEVRSLVGSVTRIVHRLTEEGILEQIGNGPHSRFRLAHKDERAVHATGNSTISPS